MPLTKFQLEVAKLIAKNRTEDSHLAGGAALHFKPNSIRYSNDLDIFNDSEKKVIEAFNLDKKLLEENGFNIVIEMSLPGYIRATVNFGEDKTKSGHMILPGALCRLNTVKRSDIFYTQWILRLIKY